MSPAERRVAILAPFNTGDAQAFRNDMLGYRWLTYVLTRPLPQASPRYSVTLCSADSGQLLSVGLDQLTQADCALVLMKGPLTPNLWLEMSAAWLFKSSLVLLTPEDMRSSLLPLYMVDLPRVSHGDVFHADVEACITQLSQYPRQDIAADHLAFEKLQEHADSALRHLETAFSRADLAPAQRRSRLLLPIDPERLFVEWHVPAPCCLIRIRWRGRTGAAFSYRPEDMESEPLVVWANSAFYDLYVLSQAERSPDGVTAGRLTDRLHSISAVSDEDLRALLQDQVRLYDEMVLGNRDASAKVPLRLTAKHPNPLYRNQAWLPRVLARRTLGPTEHAHDTYYMICYDLETRT